MPAADLRATQLAEALGVLDEAVMVFDSDARVVCANDAMGSLLGYRDNPAALPGLSVRDLFYDSDMVRVSSRRLPFPTDGTQSGVVARLRDGTLEPALVRCRRLGESRRVVGARGMFLLSVMRARDLHGDKRSQMRLLDELRRSNDRLQGVLRLISSSTLDIEGFEEFTAQVIGRLVEVLAADSVLLYLAEGVGFRLRGASEGLGRVSSDLEFVPQGYGVTSLVARSRRTMRLRKLSDSRLESGPVMLDLDTDTHIRLRTPLSRRCSSLLATPVYSYDRVMAVIVVCWNGPTVIDRSMVPLMDTVADYLSMEFATAVTQFQQRRRLEMGQMLDSVRDLARGRQAMTDTLARSVARAVGSVIPAHAILLYDTPWTQMVTAVPIDEVFLRGDPQLPGPAGDEEPAASSGAPGVPGEAADTQAPAGELPASGAPGVPGAHPDDGHAAAHAHVDAERRTALAVANAEGVGFPLTFDELFSVDESFRMVGPQDPAGVWAGRHTDLVGGAALRLSSPVTAGELPQFGLLLMRAAMDPPMDELELDYARRVAELLTDMLEDQREHANDTHIAQTLQSGMRNQLPEVPGLTSASLYLSATESAVVGGDFYDLFALSSDRLVAVIGDVSGKGVEAAAMASLVKTALAAYAWDGLGPAQIARALNAMVVNFSRAETFASLIILFIDARAHTITYCSAGHPPAMLVRRPHTADAQLELLTVQSPVIGALEGMEYGDGSVSFAPGDLLFLYTDGTTEARSPDGAFFGEDLLREVVLRASSLDVSHVPEAVLGQVATFAEGNLHDDIAMVALRLDGLG